MLASSVLAVVHTIGIRLLLGRMPISYYIIGAVIQFCLITFVRFAYRFVTLERNIHKKLSHGERTENVMASSPVSRSDTGTAVCS